MPIAYTSGRQSCQDRVRYGFSFGYSASMTATERYLGQPPNQQLLSYRMYIYICMRIYIYIERYGGSAVVRKRVGFGAWRYWPRTQVR